MSLLKDLYLREESGNDLSRLPKDVVTAIKKNIRKGAEDLQQQWPNALALVQKAYEVEGVQRPSPDMDAAWKQYEELLVYAVQQLSENRGMDGDWRMSSAMFHEAINLKKFRVTINEDTFITEGQNIDEVINELTGSANYDFSVIQKSDTSRELNFSKWGIQNKTTVKIIKE